MKLAIVIFLTTQLCLEQVTSNSIQPSFISPSTLARIGLDSQTLSTSPFYHYEKLITNLVRKMINRGEEKNVYLLLKNVIETEKAWRMDLCIRVFGPEACNSEMSSEAFYLWKKTFIYNLRKDPTQEITNRIWKNLETSQ